MTTSKPQKRDLVAELLTLAPDGDRRVMADITAHLAALGYVPKKQQVHDFVLSFAHRESGRVIAKLGVRKGRGFVSIRFFGCKDVPPSYTEALRLEIESRGEQYCGPLRSETEKNRCGRCDVCSGGGLGYYFCYPDGRELLRCGAYPILIPDTEHIDTGEMKRLLTEQHEYFCTI